MLESQIQADIRLALGAMPHVKVFRNNQGVAQYPGGQRVPYGVAQSGGSDLIGLTQVLITPEMVGQRVAIFTALEVKRPGVKVPDEQQAFVDFVNQFGGRAGIVRSVEDAVRVVSGER